MLSQPTHILKIDCLFSIQAISQLQASLVFVVGVLILVLPFFVDLLIQKVVLEIHLAKVEGLKRNTTEYCLILSEMYSEYLRLWSGECFEESIIKRNVYFAM